MSTHNLGGITLDEHTVREIYNKLNSVEGSVSDVRNTITSLKTILEHMDGDFDRLENMLNQLERILYGKGETSSAGLQARILAIEKAEEKRQTMWTAVWLAIIGLVAEALWRFVTTIPH